VKEFPDFSAIRNFVAPYIEISETSSIRKIAEGWNNRIYQVGNEYMLKTPLNHNKEKQLDMEVQISRFLQGRISVPIPSFVHYGRMEDGNFAALYRKLNGVNITNKEYGIQEDRIRPDFLGKEKKLEFFRDITRISMEIMSISVIQIPEVPRKDGMYLIKRYMNMLQLAREKIFNLIDRNTEIRIEEYFKIVLKPEVFNFRPCFIHGDLGGWNILYDIKTMKLSGLLDWGNASISDPALDYSELVYDYGDEFSTVFLGVTNQSGIKHDYGFLKRSAFYVRISGIIDALYGIENDNPSYIKQGLEDIEIRF
jgi:aminoglycoside 2''-phosphotransferase